MIPLAKPFIPEEAIQTVSKILHSGNLVQGEYVLKFENKLKEYLDIKHAILVSNGTAALHLSLIALDIKEGDEVIVPGFSFPATANVIEIVGAKPVFVDINLSDYCIDTTKIEDKISSKTKAIMPVHEFGQSAKMDDIIFLSKKYDLMIIEDAACALGSEYNSQKIGTFGNTGCFSFHPRKSITTGEGGAIVTNDDKVASKLKVLRNHGINSSDFIAAGYNYRLTDFQAAIGYFQLLKLNEIIDQRIDIASEYEKQLKEFQNIKLPVKFSNRKNTYQAFHILLDKQCNRNKLISDLKTAGVETNFGAHAIPLINYYKKKYHHINSNYNNSKFAYEHGLALPMGNHIAINQVKIIGELLNKFVY